MRPVRPLTGRDRAERELGHLVAGRLHFLVRDADELAFDHDVADREEAARLEAAQRPEREEHGGFHLDGEDASVGPALGPLLVRVVEDVARDDRPDAHGLAELLRRVNGAVDELPVGRRRVRLAGEIVDRRRILRNGGNGDDQVAELQVGLEAAAGADPQDPLHAEHVELFDHDRGRGAAHPGGLHGDRLAVERAGVAEHPALPVLLLGSVEEVLCDVLGAQRVAGNEARLCVVAFLSSNMYWHAGYRPRQCRAWSSGLRSRRSSTSARESRSNGSSWRTWRGAAWAASPLCGTVGSSLRSAISGRTSSLRAWGRGLSRRSPRAPGREC